MKNTQDLSGYGMEPDDMYTTVEEIEYLKSEITRIQKAYDQDNHEIEQILAKILNYPTYGKTVGDRPNDYSVGDHTALTLAMELDRKIQREREGKYTCPECGGEAKNEMVENTVSQETPIGLVEARCAYKIGKCNSCQSVHFPAVSLYKRESAILSRLLDLLKIFVESNPLQK